MTRWEYRTESVRLDSSFFTGPSLPKDAIQQVLRECGEQGWELVSALDINATSGESTDVVMLFKRPRA